MSKRKIVTIITAITGERVLVCEAEMIHAMRHFILPEDIFLELLERVLKEPTEIYIEESGGAKEYHLFYRIFNKKYILAIIKVIDEGAFFSSMYATGDKIRNSHKKLKKWKL